MIAFSQSRLAGLGLPIFAAMLLPGVAFSQCSVPECPPPQYEQCRHDGSLGPVEDSTQFANCLARNRERDNQYWQCARQRQTECEREEKEREQHPDATGSGEIGCCRQGPGSSRIPSDFFRSVARTGMAQEWPEDHAAKTPAQ